MMSSRRKEQTTTKQIVLFVDNETSDLLCNVLKNEPETMTQYVSVISSDKESAAFKLMVKEQIKAFSVKDNRQVRWHPTIIRLAVALFSKSSSAYNLLRSSFFFFFF